MEGLAIISAVLIFFADVYNKQLHDNQSVKEFEDNFDCGIHCLVNAQYNWAFVSVLAGGGVKAISLGGKIGVNSPCFSDNLVGALTGSYLSLAIFGEVKLPYKDISKPIFAISICIGAWDGFVNEKRWDEEEPLLREYDKIAGPKKENETDEEFERRSLLRDWSLVRFWKKMPSFLRMKYASKVVDSYPVYNGRMIVTGSSPAILDEVFSSKNFYRLRRIARYKAENS